MSEASVCLNHPNTPATHRCAVCRKPLCDTCAILDHGAAYCSQQCRADAIRTSAMVNQALDAKRRTSRRACIRSLVVLIILAALAAAAYWYYKQNAETVNRQFEQIQKEAQQQLQQGKHAIEEHTVNRKSNYKKQIESIAND